MKNKHYIPIYRSLHVRNFLFDTWSMFCGPRSEDMNPCFLIVALPSLFQGVFGHGYVEIKLEELENRNHHGNSKQACDTWIQGKECDTRLHFCLTFFTDPSKQQPCNLKKFETKVYTTSNIKFRDNEEIGQNMKNPLKLKFNKWENFLELMIHSYDDDFWINRDDLIDAFSLIVTIPPASNSSVAVPSAQTIEGQVSKLKLSVKVYCDDRYQSDRCLTQTQ